MNGNNALEALAEQNFKIFYPENNGREGLFINIQAITLAVFGNEAWALRVVSALFGTLTILGMYLLALELFCENSQFPISNFQSNSNESIFKRLKIKKLGHVLKIEHWKIENYIALLSTFFLATSFWHINFSRIGFRAIMVPFFAVFGMYFLLKGLRRGNIWDMVWAGIFIGLGFHTYIAFRFMPFVLALPLGWYFWQRLKKNQKSIPDLIGDKNKNDNSKLKIAQRCIPCAIALFLFITFITALPVGYYFLQSPHDFFGRATDVSIFSASSPAYEFIKSNILTLGMFFVRGDCNGRHNYACQPQLHPIVGIFFAVGFITAIRILFNFQFPIFNFQSNSNESIFKRLKIKKLGYLLKIEHWKIGNLTLLVWLFSMSLPATLTREGLPHALRSIGMIPPVMIFAGFGAYKVIFWIILWTEKQKEKWRQDVHQLERIKKELIFLFFLLLLMIPLQTFRAYFIHWAYIPDTYFAFSTDTLHLGQFLSTLPQKTKKYVIVNRDGVFARGLPVSAQTVMFATNTFREESRMQKNIVYVLPADIQSLSPPKNEKTVIALLDGTDRALIQTLRKKFPDYKIHAPGDFTILESRR
ncbi:MAG: hypothetical protein HYZ69_00940 [Candidatus Colwellbacteria bacterium]|nr:hypothetical protein [Candidatus Colwellbacteria bacterium]